MPAINWTAKYETGFPRIDSQHKQLFQAINDLGEAFRYGDVKAQVEKSMAFLMDFTLTHFREEEAWMREIGYPGLAQHQAEHAKLVTKLFMLKRRADAGEHMTRQVTQYLMEWLGHHIEEFDQDYIKHSKARNLGYTPDLNLFGGQGVGLPN